MKKEQIKNWEKKITKIVETYKTLDASCQSVINVGAMDPDGVLYDSIWKTFDCLLEFSDCADMISWYIFENSCGINGKKASPSANSKLRKIENPRDLARFIVEMEQDSSKAAP